MTTSIATSVQTVIDAAIAQHAKSNLAEHGITLYDYFCLYNDNEELDTQDLRCMLAQATVDLRLGIEKHPIYDEMRLIDLYEETIDYCIEEGIDVTDSAAFCHELRETTNLAY